MYLPSDHAVAFSCVMVKRDVLDYLGGQDEMFPFGLGADDDLCLRARRAGWQVATAMNTFVGHIGGAALGSKCNPESLRDTTTNLIRRRWPPATEDLISVIIPTYNCGRYLWNCLHSLRSQTYKEKEIIVVDDGSSDETAEVLSHFNVIKVTNQNNMGAGLSRNKGFDVSAGRYVVFCDADAVYEPTFLEELHNALRGTPDNIGYSYCDLRITGRRQGTHYSGAWTVTKLLAENFVCCPSLIKREHFTGFDPALHRLQDWDLWLSVWLEHGVEGVYVNQTLYTSIERPEGISGQGNADLIMAGVAVREKHGI
jgi:GT2 family glycosyltransferase